MLDSFIRETGFVKFQIESYNDFITRRIPKVLSEIGVIKPDVPDLGDIKLKLGDFKIGEPTIKEADGSVRPIMPSEARIRNLTYSAPMYVEITPVINKQEGEPVIVNFGDMPVMAKSKICPLSQMRTSPALSGCRRPACLFPCQRYRKGVGVG